MSENDTAHRDEQTRQFTKIAHQMTGDGMVSWVVLVCIAVGSGLLTLTTPLDKDVNSHLLGVLISTLTAATAYGVLVLIWLLLLRRLTGLAAIISATIAYMATGMLKAALQEGVGAWLGNNDWDLNDLMTRMITISTQWPVSVGILAFAVSTTRSYHQRLALLRSHQEVAAEILTKARTDVVASQDQLIATVRETITRDLNKLRASNPETIITDTQTFVDSTVRPLSNKLSDEVPDWAMPTVDVSKLKLHWRRALIDTPVAGLLSAWWTAITLVAFGLGFLLATRGLLSALVVYLIMLPMFYVLFYFALRICRNIQVPHHWAQFALNLIVLLAIGVLPFVFLQYIGTMGWVPVVTGTVSFVFLGPTILALLSISMACYSSADRMTNQVDELESELKWVEARISIERWALHGQIARALHGSFQALIYTHIFNYQQRFEAGQLTQADIPKLATDLEQDLDQALKDEMRQQSLAVALERIVALWSDVAKISFTYEPMAQALVEPDPALSDIASSLLHDGIVNAVRHGQATAIEVTISTAAPLQVEITLVDNGTNTPQADGAGFGSRQLQGNSLAWELTNLDPGHKLRVVLPAGASVEEVLSRQRDGVEALA